MSIIFLYGCWCIAMEEKWTNESKSVHSIFFLRHIFLVLRSIFSFFSSGSRMSDCSYVWLYSLAFFQLNFFFSFAGGSVQNVCSIRFSLLLLLIFCVFDNFMCWKWWRRTHTHATRPCGTYAIGAMSIEDATHTIQSRWYWVPDGKLESHTVRTVRVGRRTT